MGMTQEQKEEQRRILLERQQFSISFNPDTLAIPEHVQSFIDKLMREIDQYGYAIWRDNLYDPPSDLLLPDRQMFFSAYKYLEVLNALTTTQLRNLPRSIKKRDIHEDVHSGINVFYKLAEPLTKEEVKRLFIGKS